MTILASNNSAFICPKELAFALGDADAAIFLQQIHYWLERKSGNVVDGVRWIYNTYSQWLNEFPHLTEWRLRSIIKLLKSHGILQVEQLEKKQYKRRCWYTIDYKSLEALLGSNCEIPTNREVINQRIETEDSSGSSIYPKNSSQENSFQENNNTYAVDEPQNVYKEGFSKDEEQRQNTEKSSSLDKEETEDDKRYDINHKDHNAADPRDNNSLLLLKIYGFELTKQLRKLAAKYSEKEIARSLDYLDECKGNGQEIQKEVGWLTECLKNKWWVESFKSREEQAITDGLQEEGKSLTNPDAFFDKLWSMVDRGYILPMPEDFAIEGQISSFIQFKDNIFYVNWYDENFQKKRHLGIFQTMDWREAVRLFNEDCK